MPRLATVDDLNHILKVHARDILTIIQEPDAQLSFPVDGRGLRLQAGVKSERRGRFTFNYLHHGTDAITLEVEFVAAEEYSLQ